jgi:hypothetical protein
MEDPKVVIAKEEMNVMAPAAGAAEAVPQSVEEIIAGLRGFGIEDLEEILTIKSKDKVVRLKIANIPISDEMLAIQAADTLKGYLWVKRVKVEILSRSISWIDGINIRSLPEDKRYVVDPTDAQKSVRDIQVVFRNLILGWEQEVVEMLWKVAMTHAQNIEDRLKGELPEQAVFTEVEHRLFERAQKHIDDANQAIVDEAVSELYDEVATENSKPEDEKTK